VGLGEIRVINGLAAERREERRDERSDEWRDKQRKLQRWVGYLVHILMMKVYA